MSDSPPPLTKITVNGLKKITPYWYPYITMAKGRWLNREILEVVSTEFRDRSMEYYRYALESGVTTINGKVAQPDTIILNGDRIENVVHRHEPPVTSTPVRVLHHDAGREFIVIDKPGSIPVHATGRYFKNSLVEILQDEFDYDKVYPVNRLDRLTSGLMVMAISTKCARVLSDEFLAGTVRKEYIARCKGKFPEEEIVCDQPMLTVDRQIGLNIIHPEGKNAKTIFKRLHYDENTDSSVLHCRPLTGRSHQIRVHLQYLGYPIANDPIYSETRIWGDKLGKGGIDLTPSDSRLAPIPPSEARARLQLDSNPESPAPSPGLPDIQDDTSGTSTPFRKLLPRETGHDIGMGSPVPLSAEAVGIITRLRNMKDEDEDWSRWRDVVFRAKGRLTPTGITHRPLAPPHRRERGGPLKSKVHVPPPAPDADTPVSTNSTAQNYAVQVADVELTETAQLEEDVDSKQLTTSEALAKLTIIDPPTPRSTTPTPHTHTEDVLYCPECYLPLHPDPKPEKLYIFLHALRYTTSLGTFETEMPEWAKEGWEWDRGEE